MQSHQNQETTALDDFDTQTLRLPSGATARVTATWHTWLAYEELLAFYGWSEEEIITLFVQQCESGEGDPSLAFETVVSHAYAGCRPDEEELSEAENEPPPLRVYPMLKR